VKPYVQTGCSGRRAHTTIAAQLGESAGAEQNIEPSAAWRPALVLTHSGGLDTCSELTLSAEDAEAVTGCAPHDVWSSSLNTTVAGALCGGPCVALVLARVDAVATLRGCLSDVAAAATDEGLRASFGCVGGSCHITPWGILH
jgi:hypothetical protein